MHKEECGTKRFFKNETNKREEGEKKRNKKQKLQEGKKKRSIVKR